MLPWKVVILLFISLNSCVLAKVPSRYEKRRHHSHRSLANVSLPIEARSRKGGSIYQINKQVKEYDKTINDCNEVKSNGIYKMILPGFHTPMSVRCQIGPESRDGNWIVIQRRDKGKETFFRGWDDYKNGFGDLKTEFFYGLEKIHRMTNHELMQLGFIFKRRSSSEYWQIVKQFEISDENSNYKIVECNQEYGKFPHQFVHHLNYEFSTYDRKNDNHDKENCALTYRSGWWFHNCFRVNLNAIYKKSSNKNIPNCIRWAGIEECLEFTMMMLRPSPH